MAFGYWENTAVSEDGLPYIPLTERGPNPFTIYPEYLTDPNIVVCPSEGRFSLAIERMQWRPDRPGGQEGDWCLGFIDGSRGGRCARAISFSYTYYGFVMDRNDADDPIEIIGSTPIAALLPTPEDQARYTSLPVTLQAGGVLFHLYARILGGDADPEFLPVPRYMVPEVMNDIDLANVGGGAFASAGNAEGSTVSRLREGIERFMITDINNPAGSAMAQSDIYIMFDNVAISPQHFNHIPGGSNVLFMDGHVEFFRYEEEGPAPTNRYIATIMDVTYS